MKVTFNKNKIWFEFEFDQDKFGEGSIQYTDVICKDMEIVDVEIEIHDVHTWQQAGEVEIEHIMSPDEWNELEKEIKRQILEDTIGFDVHAHVSEEDQWNWYCYEQQQIQRANEDKF